MRAILVASCVAAAVGTAESPLFARAADAPAPPVLAPPLRSAPLATLRVTGGFAELRQTHFHAGFDLSTGGHVGDPVYASLDGTIERVRTSGVGYGRALYLRGDDGRLLVYGHLDAFAEPLASYVDAAQRANGQYDQDLAPAAGRFRVRAGDLVAWSGESGTNEPHLHYEIRHGDFALDPALAGLDVAPTLAPRIESVVLEPLDERAWIERVAAPHAAAAGETLCVEGRVRAIVRTREGWAASSGTPARVIAVEWNGQRLASCRDSISWAGEMSEVDQVVDRGRVTGSKGDILWHPPGVSVRFFAGAPGDWDGAIAVAPGAPPQPLRLVAESANGTSAERVVWLRGPRPREAGPDTLARAPRGGAAPAWTFAALPQARVRVRLAGTPAGLARVRIACGEAGAGERAAWDGAAWVAIVAPAALPAQGWRASGVLEGGAPWSATLEATTLPAGEDQLLQPAEFAQLSLPAAVVFERGAVIARIEHAPDASAQGLVSLGPALEVTPYRFPLRRGAPIAFRDPGNLPAGVDVYRRDPAGGDWEPLRAKRDAAAHLLRAETSRLGEFALLRDAVPPIVRLLPAPARAGTGSPYSRWQLVAVVSERGSGVDASASAFEIDGVRVPSEWDDARGQLRWRPLHAPKPGAHTVRVRVVDRAGLATEKSGRFVLESARR